MNVLWGIPVTIFEMLLYLFTCPRLEGCTEAAMALPAAINAVENGEDSIGGGGMRTESGTTTAGGSMGRPRTMRAAQASARKGNVRVSGARLET